MLNLKTTLTLACLAFVLMACPVGIEHAAGYPGKEKIDKEIVGTWYNYKEDPEVKSITITKADEFTLNASVSEAGSMYSLDSKELKGWCTEIDGMKFIYFRPVSETDKNFYHYAYKFNGKNLETYDVALLDGGVDAVTSTESFRTQLQTSMKMAGAFSDTTVWVKK